MFSRKPEAKTGTRSGQWSVGLSEEGLQEERKVEVRRGVREEGRRGRD